MDNTLVVNYSFTGVSRRAAQLLCCHHGWPLGTIHDEHPRSNLRCVLDSVLGRRPEIRYEGPDPGYFRTVVIVSPIWFHRLASPMRSFLHEQRSGMERVAVISIMGSGGAAGALREVRAILHHPPVASAVFTRHELESGIAIGRLLAFGDAFLQGAPTSGWRDWLPHDLPAPRRTS